MRIQTLYRLVSSFSISLAIAACGGGKPAVEEPEQAAEETDGKADKKAAKKDEDGGDEGDDKDEKGEASSSEGPTFTRTPKDILLAPEVVFMFSFNDSDPKKKAEEKCEQSSGDDAKKMNECMARERKKFDNADGFRFEKDDKDQWWWITVRKQGTKLVSIHKIQFEVAKEDEKSITIKPVGKDKGVKPWVNPPREVVFGVPNDYQITQDDPKHGTLVYEAKIGILGDGSKDKR